MFEKDVLDRKIELGIVTCFGGGGSSAPAPVSMAAPSKSDAEVQAAMEKERTLARLRKGRSSTILTSGLGLDDGGKKTLLGQ
jgi:carbohydrate-binding DOMON domain-containing protein